MKDSVRLWGTPEIINTDQGIQFTTKTWENLLAGHSIKVSMDGKGRCKDNIWIERFWRTIKQEWVYINPTFTVDEHRRGINSFIKFYNYKRPHQSIEELLPSMRYGITP